MPYRDHLKHSRSEAVAIEMNDLSVVELTLKCFYFPL